MDTNSGHGGGTPPYVTKRRRKRLPPMFREAFKEFCELLLDIFPAQRGDLLMAERRLILWWMRWFVMEERNGKPATDSTRQDSLFSEEKEAGEVDGDE